MNVFALATALSLLAILAPSPVEAHFAECHIENLTCIRQCEQDHLTTPGPHGCALHGRAHLGAALP